MSDVVLPHVHLSGVHCSLGICDWSNFVHSAYSRPDRTCQKFHTVATPLHRQHTSIWLVLSISCQYTPVHSLIVSTLSLTGWMQSNRLQLNNDKTEFMWSNNRNLSTIIHCDTVFNGSLPWRLHRLWSGLLMQSCSTEHFAMLHCSTPAAYHSAVDTSYSVAVAYCCTRPFPTGLL